MDRVVWNKHHLIWFDLIWLKWPIVTFEVNRLLRAFWSGIFRTVLRQLTRFQLSVARYLCDSWFFCCTCRRQEPSSEPIRHYHSGHVDRSRDWRLSSFLTVTYRFVSHVGRPYFTCWARATGGTCGPVSGLGDCAGHWRTRSDQQCARITGGRGIPPPTAVLDPHVASKSRRFRLLGIVPHCFSVSSITVHNIV